MLARHVKDGELVAPRQNIIGKPLIVWWSYDAPTERLADLALHFFTKTRWERTFRPIRAHPID
jgi:signal peptidase I